MMALAEFESRWHLKFSNSNEKCERLKNRSIKSVSSFISKMQTSILAKKLILTQDLVKLK